MSTAPCKGRPSPTTSQQQKIDSLIAQQKITNRLLQSIHERLGSIAFFTFIVAVAASVMIISWINLYLRWRSALEEAYNVLPPG